MHRTFEVFSDIFAFRDNAASRMDARVKLFVALSAIVAVILSSRAVLPLAVGATCLAFMAALRVPARLIVARVAAPLGLVAVIVVLRPFLMGGTPLFTVPLFGWTLTATREGALEGLLFGARVFGAVSVVLLLGMVTPAHKVFAALRWARVPKGWVEIAMLMYRYVFALLDDAADVAAAQQVRLGYANLRLALKSAGVLAGAVLLRSIDQAEKTHNAMVARGYQGTLPMGTLGPVPRRDVAIGCACLIALALASCWLECWSGGVLE